MRKLAILLTVSILLLANRSFGELHKNQADTSILAKQLYNLLEDSQVSAQLFLGYQYHRTNDVDYNEFGLKRGYITFKRNITPFLSGRITPDITIDREGDGMGDVEMRLKYCFAEFKDARMQGFFTEPTLLIGQVYTPFIEYEEKINLYRVEGAHFLDRINQVSSADFGVTITSLIGGKMDEDYQKKVNKNHAGRFGSVAVGVYNGGGYHALEMNSNKTFQWRLTLRPLPYAIPGLQASFTGSIGKGNTSNSPDWRLLAGFVSYEQEFFVLTGQYFKGVGDHAGELVDSEGASLSSNGCSFFSELKLFNKRVSLFGRWDYKKVYASNPTYFSRYIFGAAYHLQGKTKVVIDYNLLDNNENNPIADIGIFEVILELAF